MNTVVLPGNHSGSIAKASELLKLGEVVAVPTETVYGLAANAFNISAVEKIFLAKGRPKEDPLICHIFEVEQLKLLFKNIDTNVEKLVEAFWPGPLTIVSGKVDAVPSIVTGGLSKVGVRMPKHPIARAILKESKLILAAPSANRFQKISPTDAHAVMEELGGSIPLIIDGGHCEVGLESTVFDSDNLTILRPGAVTALDLETVLERPVVEAGGQGPILAPGMLEFHYAPRKPFVVMNKDELKNWIILNPAEVKKVALLSLTRDSRDFLQLGWGHIINLGQLNNVEAIARELFRSMRELDRGRVEKIICLGCDEEGIGHSILDRVRKASHGF